MWSGCACIRKCICERMSIACALFLEYKYSQDLLIYEHILLYHVMLYYDGIVCYTIIGWGAGYNDEQEDEDREVRACRGSDYII